MPQPNPSARASNSNVYILGAGFGTDAGLPTIANFLNQMRDSTDWLSQEGRERELKAVDAVLGFRQIATAAGYRININLDNIEDLFSLAATLPEQAFSQHVQAAIGATLNYAQKRSQPRKVRMRVSPNRGWPIPSLWRKEARCGPSPGVSDSEDVECSIYDYYAAVISGRASNTENPNRNVVITFNYDLLLEEALDRLGIPYSYGLGSESVKYDTTARSAPTAVRGAVLVIKLHGSLNWGLGEDGSITVFGSYDDAITACGHPYLVPPTFEKAATGATRTVWERALEALKYATRLIIAGFSFRTTDAHFKYLLAAGLMENSALQHVFVVNPQAMALAQQIQSVLRTDQIEYGVARLYDKTLFEFLFDIEQLRRIGRPYLNEGLDLVDNGGRYINRLEFLAS